ncbi:MAG: hypothetical protein ABJX82_20720 [Paracoccaceae bacterium]
MALPAWTCPWINSHDADNHYLTTNMTMTTTTATTTTNDTNCHHQNQALGSAALRRTLFLHRPTLGASGWATIAPLLWLGFGCFYFTESLETPQQRKMFAAE